MGGSVRQILNWPGTYETYRKVPTAIVYYQAIPAEEAVIRFEPYATPEKVVLMADECKDQSV
jgi:hypothetical protein